MTTLTVPPPAPPTAKEAGDGPDFREEVAALQRRWEQDERTRSTLTVFSIVMAGIALIASVIAVSFASTRTAAPAGTPPFAAAQFPVSLAEYKVGLPATTIVAGTKTLEISNTGMMQHELLVFHPDASVDPSNLPVDAVGNIIEDAPGLNKVSDGDNIDPGKSQTRSIDLSQPGTYVFVCNLAGHYHLGMRTVVKVVAAPR